MQIPWFYIFSPKYEVFHHILLSSLEEFPGFKMSPCFCPQSAFDRKVKEGEHFFAGNPIKFKVILEELKTLDEGAPFILSDVDIYVRNASKFHEICCKMIAEYEITGMHESTGEGDRFFNMGLMLCRNTPQLRTYFQFLSDTIEQKGIQDQALLNETISEYLSDYGLFPVEYAIQSNMRELVNTDFGVIQFLCTSLSYESNVMEKLLTAAYFIDITPVLHLVPFEVQECIVLFFKDRMPQNPVCSFELHRKE